MKRQRGAGAGEAARLPDATERPQMRSGVLFSPGETIEAETDVLGPLGRRQWRIWFPARLGPPRKRTRVIAGQRVRVSTREYELPPTKNDRLYWRVSRDWVKEWRQAAEQAAFYVAQIPPLERIRVSGVAYRTRLGVADAMNDLDRLHPLVDGLEDAGVIAKDTRRHVEHGTVTEERADKRGPGILLVIEELEHAAPEPPGGGS